MRAVYGILPMFLVWMSGCDSTTVVHVPEPHPDEPRLYGYFIVDSYGVSNEFDPTIELEIDPYHDDGIFEIYWDVESFYDYSVTLSVNDAPRMTGAVVLDTEVCGTSRSCDETGLQLCQYFPDSTMGCGYDLWEAEHNRVSVDRLLDTMPDILYINIETCNRGGTYCEFDSIPVYAY